MAHYIVRRSSRDLIRAIEDINVTKVKDLLEAGINVHARDDTGTGFTALHHAVFADDQEILKLLLEHGAYVDHISHSGIHPLDIAFDFKQVECIRTLIEHQSRVNLRLFDRLQEGGLPEEIRELFYEHVNINDRDKLGDTILLKAVQYKDTRGIEILMKRGANVNVRKLEDGQTPLHIAAKQGNLDCLKLLLQNGAQPNLKDEFGHTPLHVLTGAPIPKIEKEQAAQLLLEFGGDINVRCNMNKVALQHAILTEEGTARIWKVIVRHIAKKQHKGDHVNKANCELINNNKHLNSYHGMCVTELENIENDTMAGRVKLREFLSSKEQLCSYTRNVHVKQAFKTSHYKRQYPIFYTNLRRHFNIALNKRKLLDSAALELHSAIPQIRTNSIATENILRFLNEKDLSNLVSAGISKNNSNLT